jgi:hypothetical protein
MRYRKGTGRIPMALASRWGYEIQERDRKNPNGPGGVMRYRRGTGRIPMALASRWGYEIQERDMADLNCSGRGL